MNMSNHKSVDLANLDARQKELFGLPFALYSASTMVLTRLYYYLEHRNYGEPIRDILEDRYKLLKNIQHHLQKQYEKPELNDIKIHTQLSELLVADHNESFQVIETMAVVKANDAKMVFRQPPIMMMADVEKKRWMDAGVIQEQSMPIDKKKPDFSQPQNAVYNVSYKQP